ncbi:unnamed protein product [Toxocara canis]|uniref:WW domain-containing protein n=1 Tax=Toxocara canis TaxID=6265 RepID=A0A183UAQ5_TOXCA|nr:unnamed protein product [Toxocara canis]
MMNEKQCVGVFKLRNAAEFLPVMSDGDDIVDQPSMFDTFSDSLDFLTKSGSCAATLTNEVEDHSNTPAEKKVEDDGQEGSSRGHTFLPPPPPPPAICDDPSMEANTIIPPPPMPPEQQSLHLSPNDTAVERCAKKQVTGGAKLVHETIKRGLRSGIAPYMSTRDRSNAQLTSVPKGKNSFHPYCAHTVVLRLPELDVVIGCDERLSEAGGIDGQLSGVGDSDGQLSGGETELGEKGPEMSYSIKEGVEDNFISGDECEENIDSLLEKPFRDGQTGKVPMPNEGEMRNSTLKLRAGDRISREVGVGDIFSEISSSGSRQAFKEDREKVGTNEKTVLAHRGIDYFDVLPEGWVELTHTSGLPVYLHKATRVCTFSRPYFIGPSSVRHHCVPESAIPCLHQRRVLKEVEESAKASADALQNALDASANINGEAGEIDEEKAKLIATLQAPNTKVQTAKDFKERQLDPQALHEYAKGVFRFKTIQVYRFQKWSATRSFHRQKKLAEAERLGKLTPSIEVPVGRPTLPANVQLITVPAMEANLKPQHKGFFLNPQGKTSISILHEYVQKVLKSTISYQFTETRSSSTPYECSARLKMNLNNRVMSAASIKEKLMLLQEKQRREEQLQGNGEPVDSEFVVLGTGCGNSKKTAKLDAAKSALKVLIPAIDFDAEGIAINQKKEGEEAENEREDAVALFDMLPIEDSRIPDLSLRAGQPSPYLLLQTNYDANSEFAYGLP